ncbi:hypothetical protein [Actinophytocola sp.]|nr:hypothetical protein [Actinophytocola sp.]
MSTSRAGVSTPSFIRSSRFVSPPRYRVPAPPATSASRTSVARR